MGEGMQQEIDYGLLGKRIRELRRERGLTQDALAEIIGCNTSHISNIENNYTKASLNVLLALANTLDTTIDYLLSDQYNNNSSALDQAILRALERCDEEKKRKVLKIIEIL